MSERLDAALRWLIFGYGAICIYVRISIETCNLMPDLFENLTFLSYIRHSCGSTQGYDLMLLAVLVVFRFIVFGKTYQK